MRGHSGSDPFDSAFSGWSRTHDGELRKVAVGTASTLGCLVVGKVLFFLTFWAALVYVIVHFISKWW